VIHLQVVVADTADLLATESYGAGALLRWESAAAVDGTYTEGGTIALVAGTSLYDVWDAAGVAGTTWYQTRVSDASGTTFSAYSTPFQSAEHDQYLSPDQFRAFEPAANLSDEALLILLDAAAQDIVRAAGAGGVQSEHVHGHGELLPLSHPALSVTTVVERDVTLDATDYAVSGTGLMLRRLHSGTHPAHGWWGPVDVTYQPVDDTATRQRVQLELVKLAITFSPGLASQQIGTWSESYTTSGKTYDQQRAEILATLSDGVAIR
jgi:hypothetical protein